MLTAVATGLRNHAVVLAGPAGARADSACTGGHFTGPRLNGSLVAEHGNDWLLAGAGDPWLCLVEGLLTLCSDDGETVLVTYRGRRSERYDRARPELERARIRADIAQDAGRFDQPTVPREDALAANLLRQR